MCFDDEDIMNKKLLQQMAGSFHIELNDYVIITKDGICTMENYRQNSYEVCYFRNESEEWEIDEAGLAYVHEDNPTLLDALREIGEEKGATV